jgi:hypothetical protein
MQLELVYHRFFFTLFVNLLFFLDFVMLGTQLEEHSSQMVDEFGPLIFFLGFEYPVMNHLPKTVRPKIFISHLDHLDSVVYHNPIGH